jgi:F420-dependent oxidoreductase-like protein
LLGPPEHEMFEAYTLLGAIAARTSKTKLGTLVTGVTYRNPAILAKIVTSLDVISKGRAFLGIGAAWFDVEHAALGVDFPPVKERFERLEEALQICRAMFRGERPTFDGAHYRVKDAINSPAPITPGGPPIMIGGSGEKKTLRSVARHADMWNAMGTREFLEHKIDVLKRHCDDAGRDIAEIEFTGGCKPIIRNTVEEARRVWEAQMATNRTPMADVLDDDTFWVGTPELVAEKMAEAKALGFDTFLAELAAPYDDETLERWINEVRPMVDGG